MDDPTISLSGDWQPDRQPLSKWGPFDLQERVGMGGFGEVYRAFDPALQRVVAVKLLLPAENQEEQAGAILREARAMARVIHPNIVPIYGVQIYDGRAGFWSAYVKGKTLSALLAMNGPFGPREVVDIGVDLCLALSAVHVAGLLHRDIKAGNVMREEGGRIMLMDFGLTHDHDGRSYSGGTPGYAAPELRLGNKATVQSDIYSLGVLAYHLLTDKYPLEDATVTWSLLGQRPDLPPELARAVHTAIDPDPGNRFGNAAQMAAALSAAVSDSRSRSVAPAPNALFPTPASRFTHVWRYTIAGIWLSALAAVGYLTRSQWLPGADKSASLALHQRYDVAHDLVRNYYHPGALDKAIPMLEAITREDPSFAPAFADLGRADYLLFMQKPDPKYVTPGLKACQDAIAIDGNQAAAHTTLGMFYTLQGKNDMAAQELDTALRVDRRNAEVWGARAELYRRQGRNEEVAPALRTAMDLAPSDWQWPKQLADYYDRAGRDDLAIRADQDALRLAPDNPRTLNNLGLYLSTAGRKEEARTALQKAIAIDPSSKRYANLGGVERDLGNNSAAVELFQKAIALNPNDYYSWSYLAGTYAREHADPAMIRATYEKSISLGEKLLKTEPNNTALLADLGVMNAAIGDRTTSVPRVQQALALDPESADILFMAGEAYELMNDRPKALDLIGSAVRHGCPLRRIEESPDLAALRTDKKYLAIVASLR